MAYGYNFSNPLVEWNIKSYICSINFIINLTVHISRHWYLITLHVIVNWSNLVLLVWNCLENCYEDVNNNDIALFFYLIYIDLYYNHCWVLLQKFLILYLLSKCLFYFVSSFVKSQMFFFVLFTLITCYNDLKKIRPRTSNRKIAYNLLLDKI